MSQYLLLKKLNRKAAGLSVLSTEAIITLKHEQVTNPTRAAKQPPVSVSSQRDFEDFLSVKKDEKMLYRFPDAKCNFNTFSSAVKMLALISFK